MGFFRQLQEALTQTLNRLEQVPDMNRAGVQRLMEKLRQNRFNLVILGAFKRGKSTLINALLGEELLPTAIIPLTSVVTVLGYGEDLHIEVRFQNGQSRTIGKEDLTDYITEKGNPQNQKGVREVDIRYPSDYLKDGVRIIDTPGVGSVYSHNTEVAYNFLPEVDAAVFVVTVDPPLSAAEEEFLKDIREYVHKLFFVLNKIDYVEAAERQEALDFTRQVLRENLGADQVKIFPLSAKLAMAGKADKSPELLKESLLPQFEDHLRHFLYQEKGKVLLISCLSGALRIVTDSTLALKVERQASALPLSALKEKIVQFDQMQEGLKKEREMSLLLLDGRLKAALAQFDGDLDAFRRETTTRLRQEVEETFHRKSRGASDLTREMEQFLFAALKDLFTGWRRDEIDKLSQVMADTYKEFAERINGILDRLTQMTARIFDFSLKGFAVEEAFMERSRFRFLFKEEPVGLEILQMTVTNLLPRALTKGLFLRKLLENVTELVDKHCGRLRWDFHERLNEVAREFKQTWLEKIDDTTLSLRQALDRALAQKQASAAATDLRLGEIDQRLGEIVQLEAELKALREKVETSWPTQV